MLLQDKMRQTKFSPSEQSAVDFILEKQNKLEAYTTTMIAQETFTSPSILVRVAKKLGYPGFTEFKKDFLEEAVYLNMKEDSEDPNLPFTPSMTLMQTASSIARLEEASMQETLSLLSEARLKNAARLMKKAKTIHVFAISNLNFAVEEFVFKLRHIGINARCYSVSNTSIQEAAMADSEDLGIVVSYSGESEDLLKIARILHASHVSILAITSLGENTLSRMAAITLRCATREKSWSKIGAFSSLTSIQLLFDILYACCFQSDYEKHLDFKLSVSRKTEMRNIENQVLMEEDNSEDLLDTALMY